MNKVKKEQVVDLDKVNDKRFEETKKRVAHALLLLNDSIILVDSSSQENAIKNAAKAMSLLTTASEEMTYACEHYQWDLDVVDLMNDSISKIAKAIAPVVYRPEEENLEYGFKCDIQEAYNVLSKAFGYLLVWYDDDVKIEDI